MLRTQTTPRPGGDRPSPSSVLAAGCTSPASERHAQFRLRPPSNRSQATSGADGCTPEKYNGGVPKLDLKTITVGFAQSEKEANPFRITETQSIKDEAAKRGIKLITTNAQSDLNKEIADIQGMIAQGAKALIISPLNSEGLDPALKAAQDAKVPIMTIDRLLTTKKACVDYIGWIGSDFVEQGERAADAHDQGDRRHRVTSRSCSARPASTSPSTARRASRTNWSPRTPS